MTLLLSERLCCDVKRIYCVIKLIDSINGSHLPLSWNERHGVVVAPDVVRDGCLCDACCLLRRCVCQVVECLIDNGDVVCCLICPKEAQRHSFLDNLESEQTGNVFEDVVVRLHIVLLGVFVPCGIVQEVNFMRNGFFPLASSVNESAANNPAGNMYRPYMFTLFTFN